MAFKKDEIALTDLGSFRKLGDADQPTRVYAIDALVQQSASKCVIKESTAAFLPCLKICLPKDSTNRTLPPENMCTMFKARKKYGIAFDGLKVDAQIEYDMPLWYHLRSNKRLNYNTNSETAMPETQTRYDDGW